MRDPHPFGEDGTIPNLLTKQQVCELLGVKESWLNTEIQAGNIPHYRIGKKKFVRFAPFHIEEYLRTKEFTRPEETDDDNEEEQD
jgi:excisionase family DNA binding protein